MATVREKENRHGGKRVYNCSGGREADRGGREGFPDSALSPLGSGGARGLGSALRPHPPPPALLGGGAHILFIEKVTPPPLW